MMEQLVEDRVVSRGHRIATSVGTGADTPWLMATVVFRSAHARTTRPAVRPVLDADRKAAGGALVPLTSRARPHRPAGTVTAFFGRGPDGRIVRYYCLVNPSGARSAKSVWSAVGQSSFEIKRNHPGLLG
jgi:hypothetical protein